MGKLVSPKPKKNRLEENGRQTAPRYERGKTLRFHVKKGYVWRELIGAIL